MNRVCVGDIQEKVIEQLLAQDWLHIKTNVFGQSWKYIEEQVGRQICEKIKWEINEVIDENYAFD